MFHVERGHELEEQGRIREDSGPCDSDRCRGPVDAWRVVVVREFA